MLRGAHHLPRGHDSPSKSDDSHVGLANGAASTSNPHEGRRRPAIRVHRHEGSQTLCFACGLDGFMQACPRRVFRLTSAQEVEGLESSRLPGSALVPSFHTRTRGRLTQRPVECQSPFLKHCCVGLFRFPFRCPDVSSVATGSGWLSPPGVVVVR